MVDNGRWGFPSLEDKIVQRAVRTVLQCIYAEDFLSFSHGFRPGRSQHQALDALAYTIYEKRVNWVLDADIQGFFDEIDRDWLITFLEHRIGDRNQRIADVLHAHQQRYVRFKLAVIASCQIDV